MTSPFYMAEAEHFAFIWFTIRLTFRQAQKGEKSGYSR